MATPDRPLVGWAGGNGRGNPPRLVGPGAQHLYARLKAGMPLRETCITLFLPRLFASERVAPVRASAPFAPAARLAAGWVVPQRRPQPHALAISVAAGLAVALLGTTPLIGLPEAFY